MRSEDPRPVNVRSAPGKAAARIDQIGAGEAFLVLEGPVCSDNIAWFRISYGGGVLEGWIAEAGDRYFVAPIDSGALPQPPTTVPGRVLGPSCNAVVEDDFLGAYSPNDWFQGNGNRSVAKIVEGAYQLRIGTGSGRTEPTTWGSLRGYSFSNARIEAVVSSSSFSQENPGRVGIWVRYQDENNFLAFMINSRSMYYVGRWQNDTYTDLVNWTPTSAVNVGDNALNTLRVDIIDNTFALYINGEFQTTVTDDTWPDGRIAFFGSSSAVPVTFNLDYIRVCQQ